MYYRHNLDCFQYPERSDEHMITVKHLRDTHFDEHYQYLEKGLWHKIKRCVLFVALNLVAFPVVTIRYGLKIYGREIFKKYKKEFKDGAITIANHVLIWDYICLLKAIRPRLQWESDEEWFLAESCMLVSAPMTKPLLHTPHFV